MERQAVLSAIWTEDGCRGHKNQTWRWALRFHDWRRGIASQGRGSATPERYHGGSGAVNPPAHQRGSARSGD